MCFVFEKQKKIRPHTFTLRTGFPRARAPQNGITKQSKICILARGKIESERKKHKGGHQSAVLQRPPVVHTWRVPSVHASSLFLRRVMGGKICMRHGGKNLGDILQKLGSSFWFIWFSWHFSKKKFIVHIPTKCYRKIHSSIAYGFVFSRHKKTTNPKSAPYWFATLITSSRFTKTMWKFNFRDVVLLFVVGGNKSNGEEKKRYFPTVADYTIIMLRLHRANFKSHLADREKNLASYWWMLSAGKKHIIII